MSTSTTAQSGTLGTCSNPTGTPAIPRRSMPFDLEPGFFEPERLWLYGNVRLIGASLVSIPEAAGPAVHTPRELDELERQAEAVVLAGNVLVCGFHSPAHMRTALVPLRWGAPRVVVMSGGFRYHLGTDLKEEPFRAARLWRYAWDPHTDLAISRRAPDKLPTYACHNPTVDRLIARIVAAEWNGLRPRSRD